MQFFLLVLILVLTPLPFEHKMNILANNITIAVLTVMT
jgi:hypothetical protein